MSLPTEKCPPRIDAARKSFLLYGRSKIGKSSWASRIPGAVFIVTDPGLSEISAYKIPEDGVIKGWGEIREAVRELGRGGHSFSTVILDTADIAYQLLAEQVCQDFRVDYQGDGPLAFGKGSNLIRSGFYKLLLYLTQLPLGVVFVSHAQEKEFEDRTGTRRMWIPSLPEKAGELVCGLVDGILFADVEPGGQRVLRLKSSPHYLAGVRGGQYLPATIPLDDTEGFFAALAESLQKNAEEEEAGGRRGSAPAGPTRAERPGPGGTAPARARSMTAATTGRRSEA